MNFLNRSFAATAVLMLVGTLGAALWANSAPTAASMATGVYENDLLEFYAPGVLTNATDPDGDALSAVLLVGTQNGNLTFNADGSFSYAPGAGYSGPDSFQFAAFDGTLLSAPATVDITVIAVNTPPQVVSQTFNVIEATPLTVPAPGVLTGASDPDSPGFTAVLVSGPSSGVLTLQVDGSFTYLPGAGFVGTDSFEIQADDGTDLSLPATITIIVAAANNAPVGADVTYAGNEDEALAGTPVGLLAVCADPEGDELSFALVSGAQYGTLQLNDDGTFSYMPAPEFSGADSFSYTVSDAASTAGPYVVTLVIQAVNDAPSASADRYTLLEDEVFAVNAGGLLANDMDIEGDAISAIAASLPVFGSLVLKPDGNFEYTPQPDFNGYDSFTYYADDGQSQSQIVTVTLFVQAMNDAPSFAGAGDVSVIEDDGVVNLQWAGNISAGPADESWQPIAFAVTVSQSSKLFVVAPFLDETGVLSFELEPDAWGTADVTVILYDKGGVQIASERDYSDSVTFHILVVASNDAPSFIPGGNVNVLEDCGPQSLAWATGINSGTGDVPQQITFYVTDVSNAALFVAGPSVDANGQLSFTPAPDANGSSRVVLVLTEAVLTVSGSSSSVGTPQSFIISVQAVNDAPVFFAGPNVSVRGHASNAITAWATGITAGADDEQGQVLLFQFLGVENSVLFEGQPSIDSMGTLNFTPRRGMQGIATITLMLVDDGGSANGGQCNSQVQTFTIEIRNDDLEAQGSCSAGTGSMPWWLWMAAPMAMLAVLRRRRAMA